MAQRKVTAFVDSQERLTEDVYSMWIREEEMAAQAKPGQFISVYTKDGAKLLPRPISICETNKETGMLRIVYRTVGAGTEEFSRYQAGDTVDIMGPLGNGFPLEEAAEGKTAFLIGGGIGIPPMLELAKQLHCKKEVILGYRDVLFLNEEFAPYGEVVLATEDGSAGTKGNVIDAIREHGLKAYAAEESITCFLSLEEKMACGIGACLACVCKTKNVDEHSQVHNARICKDGPVFRAEEVEL